MDPAVAVAQHERSPQAAQIGVLRRIDCERDCVQRLTVELTHDTVAVLATETADQLGLDITFVGSDIQANANYLGGGYGVMGTPEREAIQLFAQTEGILLDPVYTSRAAAGLIDLIRSGIIGPRERILFWHTGGLPALFAPQYSSRLAAQL